MNNSNKVNNNESNQKSPFVIFWTRKNEFVNSLHDLNTSRKETELKHLNTAVIVSQDTNLNSS